ncbi:hypothetical protein PS1_034920 [Malus domestica]
MLKQGLIGPTTLVLAQLQRNCIIWLMYTLMPFSFLNVWRTSRFSSNRVGITSSMTLPKIYLIKELSSIRGKSSILGLCLKIY